MALVEVSDLHRYYLKNGKPKFEIELAHRGLNRHKVVKGDDPGIVRRKAEMQLADWEERWERQEQKRKESERKEERAETAERRTQDAEALLAFLEQLLAHTLEVDDKIEWDSLKDRRRFPDPKPTRPSDRPRPDPELSIYQPKFGLLDWLIASRRQAKRDEMQERFEGDVRSWEKEVENATSEHQAAVEKWEAAKVAWEKAQEENNRSVDEHRERYLAKEPEAVVEYCDMVLSRSDYPDFFPQEFELHFNPDSSLLVVDYLLPAPEAVPTLKSVNYVKSRDEFSEKHLTDRQVNALYDSIVYQVALRTVHELYESDAIGALESIVFNGRVETIDPATGQEINACLLSLQAGRDEFLELNLEHVDPKKCFKALKGVGSSKLHSITPVPPIVHINREDPRFVDSYEVASGLDDTTNLAAMSWEDFEHLIRELFQQEFATSGGEVKVTHASRDGGVDAIAFDPDPIRGGKIVIQAKRYTNTVGVAAVRDLYGTVMNEGATKGILVTTSDFGPDAYAFAKDKPMALLNGGNLLHLLEKHGHRAKIDIKEARRLAAEA